MPCSTEMSVDMRVRYFDTRNRVMHYEHLLFKRCCQFPMVFKRTVQWNIDLRIKSSDSNPSNIVRNNIPYLYTE